MSNALYNMVLVSMGILMTNGAKYLETLYYMFQWYVYLIQETEPEILFGSNFYFNQFKYMSTLYTEMLIP